MQASTSTMRTCCRCTCRWPAVRRSASTAASSSKAATRLSKLYAPTTKLGQKSSDGTLRSLQYLLKGAFIRQSSAGIYSLLPLGQRVIDNLSGIIEDEMYAVGAFKITLPHLLPPDLWEKSGRWESSGPELWRLKDRRESEMLLAPTHEEEITAMVAADAPSERNLPVRLFQIGRKFRDEARPRAGLLRGREFLMKDLYTFDASERQATVTYNEVKDAYNRIFDRIGLSYEVAEADTGNIGGSSSHEFHYPSPAGEDTLITCSACDYVANSELARSNTVHSAEILGELDISTHLIDLPGENTLGIAILRKDKPLNMNKIKKVDSEARQIKLNKDLDSWDALKILLDDSCVTVDGESLMNAINHQLDGTPPLTVWPMPPSYVVGDFRVVEAGQQCVQCGNKLEATASIEVAHTFLLGTRYSKALDLTFARTSTAQQGKEYYQMGCYGIGVSRLLGSVAELRCDDKGLCWPASIAPFQVCVLVLDESMLASAETLAPANKSFDVIIDDRFDQTFGKRIRDAELVGYPCVVVLGREWEKSQKAEVHDRFAGSKTMVAQSDLALHVERVLQSSQQDGSDQKKLE